MSLIRWSPFFDSFDNMERMFDLVPSSGRGNSLIPAVDVYDAKDSVIVETSVPGVDPKQIELSIENGVLTIKGSSERKTEVDEKDYYRKEIRSGSFMRQVSLPAGVSDEAEASYDNGILKISLSKKKLPASKKISIHTNDKNN